MVTPSAPSCHKIPFTVSSFSPKQIRSPLSEQETHEFFDATDAILKGTGNLRGVDFNFFDGTIRLETEYIDGNTKKHAKEEVVIDMLARKFFEENKEYIAYLHPEFAKRIWESTYLSYDGMPQYCASNMNIISTIFYRTYEKCKEYHTKDGPLPPHIEEDMMSNLKSGFKSYNIFHLDTAGSLDIFRGEIGKIGEKFKTFIQHYPITLLSKKDNQKAILFLKAGLAQKKSLEEQVSYLKKVIFLLNFQDLFKGILERMHQTASAEIDKLSGFIGRDLAEERKNLQIHISLLERTLSEFPISDVSMLIPLAFRSPPEAYSQYNESFERFNVIREEYLQSECHNAKEADGVIRNLLQKEFPEDFSMKKNKSNDDILLINRYLMGLSGLTFCQGLMGRVAMEAHRTNTYDAIVGFPPEPVKDNILMEFLLEVANCSSHSNYDWMIEKFLAHITYMMGKISKEEISYIMSEIYKLSKVVDQLPVAEALLKKPKSSSKPCDNKYVLRNSAGEKLYSLCETTRERAKLPPLQKHTSSTCSIM